MDEQPYGQEIVIQELLARYPDLLAGDQISPEAPRRWLLVTREMPVPDAESGNARWSLDHLFIDQDGVPTFVECKRAADTRSRREVVAQMLDYAANGTAYWTLEQVRQAAAKTTMQRGSTLDDEVRRLLDVESGEDEQSDTAVAAVERFWRTVEEKLRTGNVRLVFVAEETSRELRRLVEFLNEKLDGVEVLAVEVKQYLGQGQQALVPRVVGLTEAARDKKSPVAPRPRTSRDMFLAKCSDVARPVFGDILDAAQARGNTVYWGEQGFLLRAADETGRRFSFAYGYPPDTYEVYVKDWPATAEQIRAARAEVLRLRSFVEGGSFTLRAHVTEADAESVRQAHQVVLDMVSSLTADRTARSALDET